MMYSREQKIEEAKRIIKEIDDARGDEEVKVPHWLKIGEDLKYFFLEHHTIWEKGVGWYPYTEKVYVE